MKNTLINKVNAPYIIAGSLATLALLTSGVFAAAPYVAFLAPVAALNFGLPFAISCAVFSLIIVALSYAAASKNNVIAAKMAEIEAKNTEIIVKTAEVEAKNAELINKTEEIEAKNVELINKTGEIEVQKEELACKTEEIANKDEELIDKTAEIEARKAELADKITEIENQRRELCAKSADIRQKQSELDSIKGEKSEMKLKILELGDELSSTRIELIHIKMYQLAGYIGHNLKDKGSETMNEDLSNLGRYDNDVATICVNRKRLLLKIDKDQDKFVISKSKNPRNEAEYLLYIQCNKRVFRITGTYDDFPINSVADQDGNNATSDLLEMKAVLGLSSNIEGSSSNSITSEIKIQQIGSIGERNMRGWLL